MWHRNVPDTGGALCRPLPASVSQWGRKPWRERPRCARPKWPRACPGGVAHAMGVTVASGCRTQHVRRREAPRLFAASKRVECDSDLPQDPVPVRPENVVRKQVTFARACRPVAVLEMVTRARRIRCPPAIISEVITSGVTSTPSAITTTMVHLCSAPCKALRFAPPAHARGLRALTVPARR